LSNQKWASTGNFLSGKREGGVVRYRGVGGGERERGVGGWAGQQAVISKV
jgi:hypothetical protein